MSPHVKEIPAHVGARVARCQKGMYSIACGKAPELDAGGQGHAVEQINKLYGGRVLGRSREAQQAGPEYTMIGVVNDGVELNQAVKEVRELGVGPDDMTVIVKRPATAEQEPFPQGTRYITIPDDRRGLEVPIGFAVSFILLGIFFALIVPAIGVPTFVVFIALAAILVTGSFTRVGLSPILTDMEAPREEAGVWNDEFEMGRVLIFATVRDRKMIRPIREALQRQGATYYIVDRRLEPRAVHQATLHRIGSSDLGGPIIGAQKA